jgi:putative transposase
MMLERRMKVDHSTIQRWVTHYSPLLENEFRNNYKQKVGSRWRMDESVLQKAA